MESSRRVLDEAIRSLLDDLCLDNEDSVDNMDMGVDVVYISGVQIIITRLYRATCPMPKVLQKTAKFLENLVLSVVMNKDTPWTIKPWHIRVSFRKAGIVVPEHAIEIPSKPISGPDLSLEQKDFVVIVTINGREKAHVRCRIHHWSTNPAHRLPYVKYPWCLKTSPIFEEQEGVLEKLPLVPIPEKKSLF